MSRLLSRGSYQLLNAISSCKLSYPLIFRNATKSQLKNVKTRLSRSQNKKKNIRRNVYSPTTKICHLPPQQHRLQQYTQPHLLTQLHLCQHTNLLHNLLYLSQAINLLPNQAIKLREEEEFEEDASFKETFKVEIVYQKRLSCLNSNVHFNYPVLPLNNINLIY